MFIHLSGFFVSRWFARLRPPRLPTGQLPGITVVKTCVGAEDGESMLFDALSHQDYPGRIQILFTVPSFQCPANEVIDAFIAKYPGVDATKVLSTSTASIYKKVDALYDAHQLIKHELVLWSDNDVVMTTHFVRDVVSCLLEPGVSIVTSPQFDVGANNFATALKTVGNNADCATMIPWYLLTFRPIQMVLGHLVAFFKKDFDVIADEVWPMLRAGAADDQGLGHVFSKHGKRIVFRNIRNPVLYANKTLKQMVQQKERHAVAQQVGVGSPLRYLAYILTYAQIPATLWLLTHLAHVSAWGIFLTPLATRALLALWTEWLFVGSTSLTLKWFWTLFLWDLAAPYFVLKTVITQRICYHGKWYRVVNRYYLKEI